MKLKSIILTAGLAVGLGACTTEPEDSWGKDSGVCFSQYRHPGYELQVQEFEKAILIFFKDGYDPKICGATVVYKKDPAVVLKDVSDFNAEMEKELPLGPARILYERNTLGYVIWDAGCDGQAETYIDNSSKGAQSILARDLDPRRFEREFDPLLKLIEQKTRCTSTKGKSERSSGLGNELMKFINRLWQY